MSNNICPCCGDDTLSSRSLRRHLRNFLASEQLLHNEASASDGDSEDGHSDDDADMLSASGASIASALDESTLENRSALDDASDASNSNICYGNLHDIIECEIAANAFPNATTRTRFLLALVTDCGVHEDAAKQAVHFHSAQHGSTTRFVALASVSSVCGKFKFGTSEDRWTIVDRSGDYARPQFDVEEGEDED